MFYVRLIWEGAAPPPSAILNVGATCQSDKDNNHLLEDEALQVEGLNVSSEFLSLVEDNVHEMDPHQLMTGSGTGSCEVRTRLPLLTRGHRSDDVITQDSLLPRNP